MPEGIPYVGTNVIAGTGLELNYLGRHCFAYSGARSIPAAGVAGTTMLNFTTGAHVIRGYFAWHSEASTTTDEFMVVKLNGIITVQSRYSDAYNSSNDQPLEIIIPPYTNVECLFGNDGGTTATFQLTGKVYK